MMESQHESLVWFKESQVGTVIRNGVVPEWFHGIISRNMSEELLMSRRRGYFLIRVSESRIGYTLSYRADDRCRHFMIDALEDGQYIIVGEDLRHRGLQELIDFHRRTPIMPFSEVLTVACGQRSNHKSDYAELLFSPKPVNTHIGWMENNSKHPSSTLPTSEEEIPPALPHRDTMRNSAVLSPNRLYPNLSEDHPFITPPLPASDLQSVTRKEIGQPSVPPAPGGPRPKPLPSSEGEPGLHQNSFCTWDPPRSHSHSTPHERHHAVCKDSGSKAVSRLQPEEPEEEIPKDRQTVAGESRGGEEWSHGERVPGDHREARC
ncbi:hypothetical protein OYC64_021879 [Pagothenia borchgrevinki]|uniref:SH2 domain-containing protein n=1 Tax=Pagothenia borchgrevinki TaxID=8213 RepID=A0ABD2G1J4_PAGBO